MKKDTCISCAPVFFCVLAFLIPIAAVGQTNTNETNQTASSPTKRLKIAIPVRNFTEFVTITKDPATGEESYGGFAIEVFKLVMHKALPNSPVLFDWAPFTKPDGTMSGTFDDMLRNVSLQGGYDGAVGEISIRYYRADWVDFTIPYLDTSISMLVRLKQQKKTSGISLVAATKYVVVISLAFSFIVAIVFWILEYRNDKHTSQLKNANPSAQLARNCEEDWPKEILGSMIHTRLVMILFFMVLLVLIACYTASQTSSLTNQRASGSFKDLNQLRRMGSNVGYREGSFIRNLLIGKGISESKLIILTSREEMITNLLKGTAQGGVDAIVANVPNLKLLQAGHCDVFTIVPTVNFHAGGFGFAFRKDSGIAKDVSKGILRIIDDGRLQKIQDSTIGSLEGCEDDPTSGNLLDHDSLWILIAGAVAVIVLIFIILLLYCGVRSNTRKKKAVAYPCYLWPCC